MKVKVEYIPRGKTGSPLCSPLCFIGECIGKTIEDDGCYKVEDNGGFVYRVQLQDMNEV